MSSGAKERRFLDALEALFTGAEVEGDSGFINLMRMKRGYFRSLRPKLMDAIDRRTKQESAFREELFDKLHTFFSRYFCESGSIYFRHLPAFAKTYERVYAEGADVALAWKTRMLYYVKSDVLVRSMPVTLDDEGEVGRVRRFYFDASAVEHKQNNERREFVFAFAKKERTPEGPVVHLKVGYSQKGRKTSPAAIVKQAKTAPGVKVLKVNLRGLYPDIDIAESLANIVGKPIRHRTADSVTFADDTTEKTDPTTMTEEEKLHFVSLIRPYLWWGTS